jgi:hypothetical protein
MIHLLVYNAYLVCFNFETQKHHFYFCIFFSMKANQKVFANDDFVGAKHGFSSFET